jgi:energy-coupling factor transporter ATP-binding protein EcfA2
MPDSTLQRLLVERLDRLPPTVPAATDLILAAFAGRGVFAATLAGQPLPPGEAQDGGEGPAGTAYLCNIEAEGFRGIGPPVTLDIAPAPGLTLVVGRNGSGKSSFAEALEILLTGQNRRWAERSKVWGDGWRNLHHDTAAVGAAFAIDGERRPRRIRRTWPEGGDIAGGGIEVDGKASTIGELGWTRPLVAFRPFLSHNELGRILDDGPVKLHDALAGILGLGDLTDAQALLRDERRGADGAVKQVTARAQELRTRCEELDDERALACAKALAAKTWDLDAIEEATGHNIVKVADGSIIARLRTLATLPQLDRDSTRALAEQIREMQAELGKVAGSNAAQARDTADLLEQAVKLHAPHDTTDCPVCGTSGMLTYEWRMRTVERIEELRESARSVTEIHRRAKDLRDIALRLITAVPAALREASESGIDARAAIAAWERWAAIPERNDMLAIAAHLEEGVRELIPAIAAVRGAATVELEHREDRWRPVSQDLTGWLPDARVALHQRELVTTLKSAEAWMRDAHDSLRDERFRPIAEQVQENWSTLRQDSNVSLGDLRLEGAATQRRLSLDVTVDGAMGSALGVMSQGELNCLALSLFLPRASMPESPFRFLVIDDPVQAMDPAKVDGLARVLERAAADRQIIVLTHDDRLPDSVRRLGIPATVIEVSRRDQSVVHLRTASDPVTRAIEDAFAVANSSNLPAEAARVVPGFCRSAIEAACAEAVSRRMLLAGRSHDDVDGALHTPTTLLTWLALLFFDDASRGGDVMTSLNNRNLGWAADCVSTCNKGAHSGAVKDAVGLIRTTEKFCAAITASTHAG